MNRACASLVLASSMVAAAGIAAMSCESPFAPQGEGERVPLGQVVVQDVAATAERTYTFAVVAGRPYAVFLEAAQGVVWLSVVDSASQRTVAAVTATQGFAPLMQNATPNFTPDSAAVYQIRVKSAVSGAAAQFRFLVYPVQLNPEDRSAMFAIGDTVTGEAIDPVADVDGFLVQGRAGERVVAVLDPLAPSASGGLTLDVLDPASMTRLGGMAAYAGRAPSGTTGRLLLPATRWYEFRVSGADGYQRYVGLYRFWSYAIDPAPEHIPAEVSVATEVAGEAIDRAGDIDEFTFPTAAGAEYDALLVAPRPFRLTVAAGTDTAVAAVTASPGATHTPATGRFTLRTADSATLRVSGGPAIADTGAYRFVLYPIDRRPEHVSATLVPGDTVTGEAVDVPGDIDEFTFSADTGRQFNVFFQALGPSPNVTERLDLVGAEWLDVVSTGGDTGQFTGRFSGLRTVRVLGWDDTSDLHVGPYRLCLYAIDPRPEHVAGTLALDDSLSGEALDVPGDVDEFHVAVPDSTLVSLLIQLGPDASAGTVGAELIDAVSSRPVAGVLADAPNAYGFTRGVAVAPGPYTLRVAAVNDRSAFHGSYRLWLYHFGLGPESVRDTIAVGDTVGGEAIDVPGDEDDFYFYGTTGEHIDVALQGMAVPSSAGFSTALFTPIPYLEPFRFSSPASSPSLTDRESLRLDLPATGYYRLVVGAGGPPDSARGPYRFAVLPFSTAPEHVSANLVPGDSVIAEQIDALDDWDEYNVTATPGQELGIIFQSPTSANWPVVLAWDSATGDTLASVVGQYRRLAGPFYVPASGRVKVAAFTQRGIWHQGCCGYGFVGPYRVDVVAINRAPENVPTTYVVGDTVRGEAISPLGDIDEFTSSATPGATLRVWFRLTAHPVPAGGLISFGIMDPATGSVIFGKGLSFTGATPDYGAGSSFVVPPSGTYLIRVWGQGWYSNEVATAPYEFVITEGP